MDQTHANRRGIGWAVLVVLAAAVPVLADTPATSQAEIDRPDESAYPSATLRPRPPMFSEDEWVVLKDVMDGIESDESAFYILMKKAASRPPKADEIVKVSRADLMAMPPAYRAAAVRMELRVESVKESATLRPGVLAHKWDMIALTDSDDAVVVTSPNRIEDRRRGDRIAVTGYFYRIGRWPTQKGDGNIECPIIIANADQIVALESGRKEPRGIFGGDGNTKTIGLVVVLLIAYIMLRTWLRRGQKGGTRRGTYRPQRFEMTEEEIERSKREIDRDRSPPDNPPGEGSNR